MSKCDPIEIKVDATNPGQFFACCGLLELADRLWGGAEGWFEGDMFHLHSRAAITNATAADLFDALTHCRLTNEMSPSDLERLENLSAMTATQRAKISGLDDAKKLLEKRRREEPILLDGPFHLRIDWFQDDLAGGSRFKTWAGQQSVFDIASSMKRAIESPEWHGLPPENWLSHTSSGCGLPFNFDSDIGGQGSALDIGFSFDPLAGSASTRIETIVRPFLELLAFVGLLRFRPRQLKNENRFFYCTWNHPFLPELAAPAVCGLLPLNGAPSFEFRLLYRTKYLKSFLPAIPFSGGSDE